MRIDAGAITLAQTTFLQHLNGAFATVVVYALHLLYLFATLEVVVFGLVWALQRDVNWGRLFFKVIKIGLIFFIIQNFAWLLNSIIASFATLAGIAVNNAKVAGIIFNPAKIWQYGYNVGLHLLQVAAQGNNFGLTLIQCFLGMGILLVFGLLGIQLILQTVAFYLVAFAALILLPFGTFSASARMFDTSIQAVLKAGVRVMVLMIVIGIGVVIWDSFDLENFTVGTLTINPPLGLFFTTLLFLILAWKLPTLVAATVGEISSGFLNLQPEGVSVSVSPMASAAAAPRSMVDFQAATNIEAGAGGIMTATSGVSTVQAAGAVAPVAASGGASFGSAGTVGRGNLADETLDQAAVLGKSISDGTLQKIRDTLVKVAETAKHEKS